VIGSESAVSGEAQFAFELISTVITSPLAKAELLNVELLVPVFTPFTFHWYEGFDPPLTGVAVKFTIVPGQTAVEGLDVIETAGVSNGFTCMVIEFDVAEGGDAQATLEVSITVTTSPSLRVVELKVAELVPAFTPFTCH